MGERVTGLIMYEKNDSVKKFSAFPPFFFIEGEEIRSKSERRNAMGKQFRKVAFKRTVHCDECGKEIPVGTKVYVDNHQFSQGWACSLECARELRAAEDAECEMFHEAIDSLLP